MPENSTSITHSKQNIVIIDDEPFLLASLNRILDGLGYQARIYAGANTAYVLTDKEVVFLDVMMPGKSGLHVLEQLAHEGANCAIILMSASSDRLGSAEKLAKSLNLNLIGVLQKPFSESDVRDILDDA